MSFRTVQGPRPHAVRDVVPKYLTHAAGLTKAEAQKAVVAAILELRRVAESGTSKEVAAAIEVFAGKAIAYDLVARERED